MTFAKKPGQANYCACGDHAWAPVGRGLVTLVSTEDASLLADQKWSTSKCGNTGKRIVMARKGHRMVYLHHLIVDASEGAVRDHKNRNRLDNRRDNLRECKQAFNTINRGGAKDSTSKFKGVSAQKKLWVARIGVNGDQLYLGHFRKEEDAAKAYDAAAQRYFGEFAVLNFEAQHVGP